MWHTDTCGLWYPERSVYSDWCVVCGTVCFPVIRGLLCSTLRSVVLQTRGLSVRIVSAGLPRGGSAPVAASQALVSPGSESAHSLLSVVSALLSSASAWSRGLLLAHTELSSGSPEQADAEVHGPREVVHSLWSVASVCAALSHSRALLLQTATAGPARQQVKLPPQPDCSPAAES